MPNYDKVGNIGLEFLRSTFPWLLFSRLSFKQFGCRALVLVITGNQLNAKALKRIFKEGKVLLQNRAQCPTRPMQLAIIRAIGPLGWSADFVQDLDSTFGLSACFSTLMCHAVYLSLLFHYSVLLFTAETLSLRKYFIRKASFVPWRNDLFP